MPLYLALTLPTNIPQLWEQTANLSSIVMHMTFQVFSLTGVLIWTWNLSSLTIDSFARYTQTAMYFYPTMKAELLRIKQ